MIIVNPFPTAYPSINANWNPADKDADVALSVGDTVATIISTGTEGGAVRGVTGYASSAHQYELAITSDFHLYGLANLSASIASGPGADANGWAYWSANGNKYNGAGGVAYAVGYNAGDVMGCVWYANTGDIVFFKNGVWQGLAFTGVSGTLYPMWGPGTVNPGTRTATIIATGLTYPVAGASDWAGISTPAAVSTWNPSDKDADVTLFAGNTIASITSTGSELGTIRGTVGRSSGVWQAEFICIGDDHHLVGIANASATLAVFPGADIHSYGWYNGNGNKYYNYPTISPSGYGASWVVGDVIGMVWDATAGTLTFYKNGTSQGTAFTGISGTFFPAWGTGTTGAGTRRCYLNTGQTAFRYPIGGATAWG